VRSLVLSNFATSSSFINANRDQSVTFNSSTMAAVLEAGSGLDDRTAPPNDVEGGACMRKSGGSDQQTMCLVPARHRKEAQAEAR
jgi:hypothetical protein